MNACRLTIGLLLSALYGAAHPQLPEPLPLDKSLVKARADGKYRMLLRQIRVPNDFGQFSAFYDFGYRTETTCAEYTDLPKGYWVYVCPYWYIWRDLVTGPEQKRPWGPEQATGKPDTPEPGDYQSAWASATQDESDEWLMLEYEGPVWAKAAHIYETYNPGAVVRITAFTLDGREVEIWSRPRPDRFPPSRGPSARPEYGNRLGEIFLGGLLQERGDDGAIVMERRQEQEFGRIFKPAFTRRVLTNRIKVYLASKAVPGWNEIDAVELVGDDGSRQWATAAHASSIFGVGGPDVSRQDPRDERIRQLEEENRRLHEEVARLKGGR